MLGLFIKVSNHSDQSRTVTIQKRVRRRMPVAMPKSARSCRKARRRKLPEGGKQALLMRAAYAFQAAEPED